MPRYLIDANLPYYFSIWHGPDFVHVRDLNDEWTDAELWAYAKEHSLTIVSKDADFSDRILVSEPPPRVIHVKLGNLRMNAFHQAISKVWAEVCELSRRYRLVRTALEYEICSSGCSHSSRTEGWANLSRPPGSGAPFGLSEGSSGLREDQPSADPVLSQGHDVVLAAKRKRFATSKSLPIRRMGAIRSLGIRPNWTQEAIPSSGCRPPSGKGPN